MIVMEGKGVTFNYDKSLRPTSFTVTVNGDQYNYLRLLKSLLGLVRNQEQNMLNADQLCDVCDLISDMLPTEEQLVINPPQKNVGDE